MERVTNKLKDILLLPVSTYQQLTDSKFFLFAGILLVGCADFLWPMILSLISDQKLESLFSKITASEIFFTFLFVALIGLIDVFCFAKPLVDIFSRMFRENVEFTLSSTSLLIRVMKVYILTNFVVLPWIMILDVIVWMNHSDQLWTVFVFVFILWFALVSFRGINALYDFKPKHRQIVFLMIIIWNYILGMALQYIMNLMRNFLNFI